MRCHAIAQARSQELYRCADAQREAGVYRTLHRERSRRGFQRVPSRGARCVSTESLRRRLRPGCGDGCGDGCGLAAPGCGLAAPGCEAAAKRLPDGYRTSGDTSACVSMPLDIATWSGYATSAFRAPSPPMAIALWCPQSPLRGAMRIARR